ncbi:MAG: DUF2461 domain-containing protein [Pseudomonadota bacterium]
MAIGTETIDFLRDLEANNSTAWLNANRDRYEREWLAPAQQFVHYWKPFLEHIEPPLVADAKINKSIRRINRDLRFSKDKRPYDPKLHMVFWHGAHPTKSQAIHFVVKPTGVALGVGQWSMTPKEIHAYRQALCSEQKFAQLKSILSDLETAGYQAIGPSLKTVPKCYFASQANQELLRRKNLVLTTGQAPKSHRFLEDEWAVMNEFTRLAKLVAWLTDVHSCKSTSSREAG